MGFWSKLWSGLVGSKSGDLIDERSLNRAALPVPHSDEPARETFGVTAHDPVLCDLPAGEQLYIVTLRCPQGHRLSGPRLGSMSGKCTDPKHHQSLFPSENPAEECIVDCYDLVCEEGEYSCKLYFDMYHPNPPPQPAPRGMTRVG